MEPWNQAVRALRRSRPRAGRFCLLIERPDGTIVCSSSDHAWEHAWFTTPNWTGRGWEASVKPGFVNEWDPIVPGVPRSSKDPRDAELIERPSMPLRAFRSIPDDGEPMLPFFKALGAVDLRDRFSLDGGGNVTITEKEETKMPPRLLLAADIYVAVARATYQAQVNPVDPSGGSGQIVDYTAVYNTDQLDRAGSRPRLLHASKFPAVISPSLLQRLSGNYQDEGEDRVLISTVYFLSPPNVLSGSPDGSWTPYVKHNQFWNLNHAGRNIPPVELPGPIRFFSGLAGGLGDIVVNQYLSLDQDLLDKVGTAVLNSDNAGRYWSA